MNKHKIKSFLKKSGDFGYPDSICLKLQGYSIYETSIAQWWHLAIGRWSLPHLHHKRAEERPYRNFLNVVVSNLSESSPICGASGLLLKHGNCLNMSLVGGFNPFEKGNPIFLTPRPYFFNLRLFF